MDVQHAIPAPLNYRGFPKSICTSVNHVVCHGIPGDKTLRLGDIVNVDITVIKDGFHGDSSRMFFVGKGTIQGERVVAGQPRGPLAGNRAGPPRQPPRRHRPRHPAIRRGTGLQRRA